MPRAVELAPGLWWLRWFYGTALLLQGKYRLGFRQCQLWYDRNPSRSWSAQWRWPAASSIDAARRLLTELEEMAERTYVAPLALGWAYLGVGDDRAFEWLDKAIERRNPVVTHLPSMPLYDGIRHDPRFRSLLEKMHLA
jgi:hypothetical protein